MIKILCALLLLLITPPTGGSLYKENAGSDLILNNLKIDNLNISDSSKCSKDMSFLLSSCVNKELWAQMMMDATGKMEAGVLLGRRMYTGRYDECIGTETPTDTFSPQFCLVEINVPSLNSKLLALADAPIKETLLWGICVPSSCSAHYLNITLNNLEMPFVDNLSSYVTFELANSSCAVRETTIDLNMDTMIVVGVLLFIGLINVSLTIYDGWIDGKSSKFVSSFSAVRNFPGLTAPAKSELGCLGGLVATATLWAMMGTNYRYQFQGTSSNLNELIKDSTKSSYLIFNNSSLGEDMLLLVAGFMVASTFYRQIQSKGGYDHIIMLIKTYIKWTVPVAMCIAFVIYVMPFCGSGPIWNRTTEKLQKSCQLYWLYKLFYVQNYVENVSQCMSQTWLLDTQMQLFWLSPIILYSLLWSPNIALILSSLLAVASTGLEFYISNANNLGLAFGFSKNSEFLLRDYYKTYCRATPWFIGCTLGIIIIQKRMRGEKYKLGQIALTTGWILASILMISSFISTAAFDDEYKQPLAALALSLKRLAWGSGIAWIIFACVTNNAGTHEYQERRCKCVSEWALEWNLTPFQLFKRLSFASYLVQDIVFTYKIGLMRDSRYIADVHMYYNSIISYVMISITAFLLVLTIQLPTRNLVHLLFKNLEICQYPKEPLKINEKNIEKIQPA